MNKMNDNELLAYIYGIVSTKAYCNETQQIYKVLNKHFHPSIEEQEEDE